MKVGSCYSYTTTTGVGGTYYYEIVGATGTHTDYFGQVLGTLEAQTLIGIQTGAGSYSGRFQ